MRLIKPGDVIVVDYETTGLSIPHGAEVFSVVLTWIDDGHTEIYDREDKFFLPKLKAIWENEKVEKVAHHLKFEYKFTTSLKIVPRGKLHCTMIQHQLLHNLAYKHSLDYAARQYAGIVMEWDEADKAVDKCKSIYGDDYSKFPRDLMHKYMMYDGERTALLHNVQYPLISAERRSLNEYHNEIALIRTTARMESNGIMIERKNAKEMLAWMDTELKDVDVKAEKIVGGPVNLQSHKQLKKVLFEKFKLPSVGTTKSGEPSTDKGAIEALRDINDHPILDLILKKRSYTKGQAMINAYLEYSINDILYPNINTNAAGTGRESSSDPINFQNIQKEVSLKTRFPVAARRCFRARPKYFFFLKDFQGIEMRLYVQGTNEPRLIKLVEQNFDFHDACAKNFYNELYTVRKYCLEFFMRMNKNFKKEIQDVYRTEDEDKINAVYKKYKKTLRSAAKNGRFAMAYGAGIDTLASTLMLSYAQAYEGKARDKDEYPEFYAYMDKCTRQAKKFGYIETFFGRKLNVPSDRPYAATDYAIQGSAAGVMKRAQVAVDAYIEKELDDQVKLILPIHDEIIFEYPRSLYPQRNEILSEIRKRMINIECITVPLEIEVKMTTTTWDRAVEYKEAPWLSTSTN
jgi:DNA polymerase I